MGESCETDGEHLVIGKITAHHGIKGWVRIHSYTRPAEQITDYATVFLSKASYFSLRKTSFAGFHRSAKSLIAEIENVRNREDAEPYLGCSISIFKEQLSELSDGEYYWFDIIGSQVINAEAVNFGTVVEMLETGANDVMVVRSDDGKSAERLIPWIDEVVRQFDTVGKVIGVDWKEDY